MEHVIVGGHGKVARNLTRLLTRRGDSVRGIIRDPRHHDDLRADGASAVLFDLEGGRVTDLAEAMAGADDIVFAAGAGSSGGVERKRSVDRDGAILAATAARAAGVPRFLLVSSFNIDKPQPPDAGAPWLAYLEAKREAETALNATSLDWTILRPGALTDDPATGRVHIAHEIESGSIPRADVAAVIAALLATRSSIGQTLLAVSGDEPVEAAVRRIGFS
jgi:uncharacterized protein YbjT (DUF2867 family)